VTGFARKGVVEYNPVVFTYGRWLNSDNLVVALKAPSAVRSNAVRAACPSSASSGPELESCLNCQRLPPLSLCSIGIVQFSLSLHSHASLQRAEQSATTLAGAPFIRCPVPPRAGHTSHALQQQACWQPARC